ATHDPHIVQGTGYLEYGRIVDIGAAHVQTYLDAKGTLVCDAFNSGLALLLATAMGNAGQLVQNGSSALYELGGSFGVRPEAPETHAAETWESTATYSIEEQIVLEGTTFYKNIKPAGNTNKKPSTESTFWTAIAAWASGTTYSVGNKVAYTPSGGKAAVYTCIKANAKGEAEGPNNSACWTSQQAQSGSQFDMQLGVPTNQ